MQNSVPDPVFLNVEFIFSWLWGHIFGPLFSVGFLQLLEFLASILVILGIAVIIYSLVRLNEIRQADDARTRKAKREKLAEAVASAPLATPGHIEGLPGAAPQGIARNETWENIRSKLLSDSTSDWRLAIIEADIYLDRILDQKGYGGDTIGDKLKNLTPDRLPSVQTAWEAHKVRNRIAHDGAAFMLTMPEARRVLSYYEIVFRDLGVIE